MGDSVDKKTAASQFGWLRGDSNDASDLVTLDPRVIKAGFDLTGYYIETGLRSFTDYARKMIEEYGHDVQPYLVSWYLAVRYYPGVDPTGMDSAARVNEIMSFDDGCC